MSPATAAQTADRTHGPAPHAMPAWIYGHPQLTKLEIDRILKPSWQIACHVNSIPKAGDYVTLQIGPESVFVMRDREGSIRGFHNVCRHRGTRIFDRSGHCPGPIVCPYHGWSYKQDGSLQGVARADTFPALDKAALSLTPVRVDVALGFVFVCLSGDPRPVLEVFAPVLDELAPYRFEEMVPLGPITTEEWACDWKVAIDNYLESYHVPIGHPGLQRMFTPDYDDQHGGQGLACGTSWLREQPSSRWSERMYQQLVLPTVKHLPDSHRRSWRFYSLLPNLGLDVFPEQMDFFQVLPKSPGRTLIRSGVFGLPDARREMRVLRGLGIRINNEVNRQDKELCERVQLGLGSSGYVPGPLSNIEHWMLEFHQLLRNRIPETRLPAAPNSFS
jgi:phenylpropionate dioxygenase-like ring-hydroxylating dioxygenase large terminal subunit